MPKVLQDVASRAVQVHGSLGVSDELPLGAMVLESLHMGLVDGATEVHKITLARELLSGIHGDRRPVPDAAPAEAAGARSREVRRPALRNGCVVMTGEFDLEQTDRLLTTTRAVRKRLDLTRPVEREVVLDCLRIAQQAPSGGNRQRGRWLVVRDEAKKKAIADLYARSYEDYITPQLAVLDPEDGASVRMVESSRYLADHIAGGSAARRSLLHPQPAGPRCRTGGRSGLLRRDPPCRVELPTGIAQPRARICVDDVAPGVRNRGQRFLDIPLTVTQVALLPVAYYRGEGFAPAPRRPVEEVTYVDAWRAPWE